MTIKGALTLLNSTDKTAGETGDTYVIPTNAKNLIARISATENSGTATLDGYVETSPTGAAGTWKTLATFTQLSASGVEDVHITDITTVLYPCYRAVTTITGTGNYDYKVELFFD